MDAGIGGRSEHSGAEFNLCGSVIDDQAYFI
jgi:hypothetical protein